MTRTVQQIRDGLPALPVRLCEGVGDVPCTVDLSGERGNRKRCKDCAKAKANMNRNEYKRQKRTEEQLAFDASIAETVHLERARRLAPTIAADIRDGKKVSEVVEQHKLPRHIIRKVHCEYYQRRATFEARA